MDYVGPATYGTVLDSGSFRIERIITSGYTSPEDVWYEQDQDEWIVVLEGAARLRFDGEAAIELGTGDFVNIPAHRRHRIEWTTPDEPTIMLSVHYGGPQE